jgi:hypothetical protein
MIFLFFACYTHGYTPIFFLNYNVNASNRLDLKRFLRPIIAYENPGVQLPESIITWVAIRGMPEYMNNLRSDG